MEWKWKWKQLELVEEHLDDLGWMMMMMTWILASFKIFCCNFKPVSRRTLGDSGEERRGQGFPYFPSLLPLLYPLTSHSHTQSITYSFQLDLGPNPIKLNHEKRSR